MPSWELKSCIAAVSQPNRYSATTTQLRSSLFAALHGLLHHRRAADHPPPPWRYAVYLDLEAEAEEGSDQHDDRQHDDIVERRCDGNSANQVAGDKNLEPQQNR